MSKYARYHASRRARLIARIGGVLRGFLPVCQQCGYGPHDGLPLEIAHLHGNGGEMRARRGNAGEITRLLSMPEDELLQEVTLMCQPCHRAHDLAAGHMSWKGEFQPA